MKSRGIKLEAGQIWVPAGMRRPRLVLRVEKGRLIYRTMPVGEDRPPQSCNHTTWTGWATRYGCWVVPELYGAKQKPIKLKRDYLQIIEIEA